MHACANSDLYARPCATAALAACRHVMTRLSLHVWLATAHRSATAPHSSSAFAAQNESEDPYLSSIGVEHATSATTPPNADATTVFLSMSPPFTAFFSQGDRRG